MVSINFEISGFDLAEVLKSVAGETGVTINIYTLQEVGTIPQNIEVVTGLIEEDNPVEEEVELISKDLSYEEATMVAVNMRNAGKTMAYIGRALGISGKSASRRINKFIRLQATKEANKVNREKQLAKEDSKPIFEDFSDEDLIEAIYGTVSVSKGVYLSSHLATVLKHSINGKYRKSSLVEFNKNIHARCDDLFRKVGMCLGRGSSMTSTTMDELGRQSVQIHVVNLSRMASRDIVLKEMKEQGWI